MAQRHGCGGLGAGLLIALASQAAPAAARAAADAPPGPSVFGAAVPACPPERAHCFRIALHVAATGEGAFVETPAWFATEFETANRLFAPIGVGFSVARVDTIQTQTIVTREDRDELGRGRTARDVIDVFVVGKLADVDQSGRTISGVHWRDRRNRQRRWIIVAARAWSRTLAHELGHYFTLPHSDLPDSPMNVTAPRTPLDASVQFTTQELERMRLALPRTRAAASRQ